MCTAINMRSTELFGRTLDLEKSLGEEIVITPSGYNFTRFRTRYSIIGVAAVRNGIPLYFDGMNEKGLCAAALNYPQFAVYGKEKAGALNLPSFDFLPYVLGNCESVEDAYSLLSNANITDTPFSAEISPSPLHWIIADKISSLCAEPDKNRLNLYPNPFNVLTNAPDFNYHTLRICDCMALSPDPSKNLNCPDVTLKHYSRGMGAMGLPGDFSSSSRFIRALFALEHTKKSTQPVSDFFHIMETVSLPKGTVIAENGSAVRTVYTSCADRKNMTYYFTTYGCRRIRGVKLTETEKLLRFSMENTEDIYNLRG